MGSKPRPTAPVATLAKFSRPRLFNVQKRERLFRLLDERRAHPILWIAGPPGSGKSTLVASYVEARKAPGLWFQADPGDADPATFFHYVRVGVSEIPGRRSRDAAALPVFTADYAGDLPGFSRRFMRELFALFPAGSILVVDNFHEPKADASWRFAFAEGLREVPEGINLIFLSREPPVPEMARLVGEQRITRIDWEALRFTPDETEALTAGIDVTPDVARAIHKASDGWAAGIVLMREHAARHEAVADEAMLPEGKEAVFQYFTGEIFGRARPENQRVLMLSALLPSVSPDDAIALSGNPEAPRVLDYVYRRHLFTDRRRAGDQPVYSFHALFREFLLEQGKRKLPRKSVRRRSTARRASSCRAATSTPPRRSTSKRRHGLHWWASRCTPGARCSRKAVARPWYGGWPPCRRRCATPSRAWHSAKPTRSCTTSPRAARRCSTRRTRHSSQGTTCEGSFSSPPPRSTATTSSGPTSRRSTAGSTC